MSQRVTFRSPFPLRKLTMPKAPKKRTRVSKSEPFDTMMIDEVDQPAVDNREDETEQEGTTESNHAIFKRHAGEWKRMKAQVAQLKKQRKALTKKQRDKKKQISQEIKMLISSIQNRHDEELRGLGIIPPKRADLMEDDEE